MPYPSEHAAQQRDPSRYDRIRRTHPDGWPDGVDALLGVLEGDDGETTEIQSIRFDVALWTVSRAREWLEGNDFSTKIELATGSGQLAQEQRKMSDRRVVLAWQEQPSELPDAAPNPDDGEGRPIHVFRLGPLFDRMNGEKLDDITDDMLAEIVRVFDETCTAKSVPIDWNHGSALGRTPDESGALGEIVRLEHVSGEGMWAVPRYTERGRKIVEEADGILYTSPEFYIGPIYDQSEERRIGMAAMLALALTNRPMQDRLEPVRLSETGELVVVTTDGGVSRGEGHMADETTQQEVERLQRELAERDAELERLRAAAPAANEDVPEGDDAGDEPKAPEPPAGDPPADNDTVQLSETAEQVRLLSEKVTMLEAEAASAKAEASRARRDREIDQHQDAGLFAPGRRTFMERLYDTAHDLYSEEIDRLRQAPEVPTGQLGHDQPGTEPGIDPRDAEIDRKVKKYCEEHGMNPQTQYHVAFAAVRNGGEL